MRMRLQKLGIIGKNHNIVRFLFVFSNLLVFLIVSSTQASEISLIGNFVQGGLIKGKAVGGVKIILNDQEISIADNGNFLLGFGHDASPINTLEISFLNGSIIKKQISIIQRKWITQKINGLPNGMVNPADRDIERINHERNMIYNVRQIDSDYKWAWDNFNWPLLGIVTGVYGSRRILNGEIRQPHFGVDIAQDLGAEVVAPASGIVVLAEDNLYFTGGTIILDHGYGISSTFSHLSKLTVFLDSVVKKGEKIGEVGATGRATGPHLDWRVNWFNVRLDPALLVPIINVD